MVVTVLVLEKDENRSRDAVNMCGYVIISRCLPGRRHEEGAGAYDPNYAQVCAGLWLRDTNSATYIYLTWTL